MRRFLIPLVIALGLTSLVAGTAQAAPKPKVKTYTITRTFGPYNGLAAWWNGLPGQLSDGEALWVACDPFDRMASHDFSVDRQGGRKILRVVEKGVSFSRYEPDDVWMFYIFFEPTLRPGWNKVTMTATCRDTAAPFRR